MRFTEEMLAEDEKRWHARDVITELGYCGNYIRDRKNITNLDIRFYAYIMRKAYEMLKAQQSRVAREEAECASNQDWSGAQGNDSERIKEQAERSYWGIFG